MDEELKKKIEEQGVKIDAVYKSVEKMRKYFLITTWVTILTIVVPLIAIAFILPSLIGNYTSALGGL